MIASDASPLICLAKAEKLSLLREMFGKVVIEEEVKRKTIDRGKEEGAPDALVIEDALKEGWIEVEKIENEKRFSGIHKGEGNTILLAEKHKMRIMKILVTGGVCFIGSHVLRRRIESGKDAVIYDNLRPSDVEILLCDCSKFRQRTGWKPRLAFEDTMRDLLDY